MKYKLVKKIIIALAFVIFLISLLAIIFFTSNFFSDKLASNLLFSSVALITFLFSCLLILVLYTHYSNNKFVNEKMSNFDQSELARSGFGVMVVSIENRIIWISDFINERFGRKILNKSIEDVIPSFKINESNKDHETIINKNNAYYEVKYIAHKMIITFRDVTLEHTLFQKINNEKTILGEIDVDNYQNLLAILSEDDLFLVSSTINLIFEKITQKYDVYFKSYSSNKYLFITSESELKKLIENNFDSFLNIPKIEGIKSKLSFSIGIAKGCNDFSEMGETAKEALLQSQNRGGNQITIINKNGKTLFFGSQSEIAPTRNRTVIKQVSQNLNDRLKSKEIKNIIIYGHINADLDSIGASLALYEISKHFGKETYIQNQTFDQTALKSLEMNFNSYDRKEIFISKTRAKQLSDLNTLVIIVDCSSKYRTENTEIFHKIDDNNIFVFDHHRMTKLHEKINNFNVYIESTASSTCEIITEVIEFNNYKKIISTRTAQMLLDGIYLDSNKFQKSTSSRTFAAASILEEMGASTNRSIEILKMSNEELEIVTKILQTIIEIKPGFWLAAYKGEAPIDMISLAADEILRVSNRKAAFVIAELPKSKLTQNSVYKLSARGIDTNVQIIAENVGGGGHFSAAAATSDEKNNESFETFKDNIIQAIMSSK